MQNAETVLDVLRERGRRGLPCDELYRQLFNPQLYLLAYGRLYSNQGAMTPGADGETVDGMSLGQDRAHHRCAAPRALPIPAGQAGLHPEEEREDETARPAVLVGQARRRSDPPPAGGVLRAPVLRPLPRFPSRPGLPHRAARGGRTPGPGRPGSSRATSPTASGRLTIEVMLAMLAEKIHDNRFLRLLRNMLQAGYLEDWEWNATLTGAPQGGVVSPILSNIYLDRLDKFVETVLMPEYTRGDRTGQTTRPTARCRTRSGVPADAATAPRCGSCASSCAACPAGIPEIPATGGCATADTPTITSSGSPDRRPKPRRSRPASPQFLRDDLKLELSEEKTLITHARTGAARFLGYEITVQHADHKITSGQRSVNGDRRAARAHGR